MDERLKSIHNKKIACSFNESISLELRTKFELFKTKKIQFSFNIQFNNSLLLKLFHWFQLYKEIKNWIKT
jgi:hypothetical protein